MEYNISRNSKYIIAAVIAAIVAFLIWKLRRRKIDATGRTPGANPDNLTQPAEYYDALALRMRNAIFGISDSVAEKTEVINTWLSQNDDEFKYLYALYNTRYATPPETIRGHINAEFAINPFKLNQFNNRLASLGLA